MSSLGTDPRPTTQPAAGAGPLSVPDTVDAVAVLPMAARGLASKAALVLSLRNPGMGARTVVLAGSIGAALALSQLPRPPSVVMSTIRAARVGPDEAPALLHAAAAPMLRDPAAPDPAPNVDGAVQTVDLVQAGTALMLTTRHPDLDTALRANAALAATLLDNEPERRLPAIPAVDPNAEHRAALGQSLAVVQARAATVSTAVNATTREMAASLLSAEAARAAARLVPDRTSLTKTRAVLADLQVQRIQLAAKYKDDHPPLAALTAQIAAMKALDADLTRQARPTAPPPAPNPAYDLLGAERTRLQAELAELDPRQVAYLAELAALPPPPAAMPALALPRALVRSEPTAAAPRNLRAWSVPLALVPAALVLLATLRDAVLASAAIMAAGGAVILAMAAAVLRGVRRAAGQAGRGVMLVLTSVLRALTLVLLLGLHAAATLVGVRRVKGVKLAQKAVPEDLEALAEDPWQAFPALIEHRALHVAASPAQPVAQGADVVERRRLRGYDQ